MTPPETEHLHPRRARRALRTAWTIGALGIVAALAGFWYFLRFQEFGGGWPIALIPMGFTGVLLAVIWYFSYMEELEPELYEHTESLPEDEA